MKILREKTPEFWEQAWQEAHKYSLHARKRRELDQLDYWNSMAKFFANTAKKKAGKKRPQRSYPGWNRKEPGSQGAMCWISVLGQETLQSPWQKSCTYHCIRASTCYAVSFAKTFVMKGLVMYSIWTRNGRLLIHSRWVSLLVLILSSLHSPLASEMWRH